MKKVMMNYRPMFLALLVAFTVSLTAPAMANDETKSIPGLELKFIGNKDNQPVFQLILANPDKEEYVITIKDNSGYVLYADTDKSENISKRFILQTETLESKPVILEVRSKKTNKVQAYEIGRTQKVVTETVVNKIK